MKILQITALYNLGHITKNELFTRINELQCRANDAVKYGYFNNRYTVGFSRGRAIPFINGCSCNCEGAL